MTNPFYDLVEKASPGPYLEMFARRARLGWDRWGDEADSTIRASGGGRMKSHHTFLIALGIAVHPRRNEKEGASPCH